MLVLVLVWYVAFALLVEFENGLLGCDGHKG